MKKLFNKLLTYSNSYNFYKSNYERLKTQLAEFESGKAELQLKMNQMSEGLNTFQKTQKELEEYYPATKNEINEIKIQINLLFIKQGSKNCKPINIIFLVNFRIAVMDNIINLFGKDPHFNPIVVVIPYDTYGFNIYEKELNEHQLQEYEENFEYFKRRGFNVIKGYDNELNTLIDIESETRPDIIFYSTPWEESFPEQFRIENLPENIIFCYIPYGIHASQNEDNQFNRELHKKAWKLFYPTKIHKELAAKYSLRKSSNVVVMGYPKLDPLIDGSHEKNPYPWNYSKKQKKRVIWAPHHSIKNYIRFSTFDKNYKFFHDLAKAHSEIEWVFKPHPNLRHYHLISSKIFPDDNFNEKTLVKYYNAWDNLPNATVYEGGDYFNLFATSDAMITDSVSFLSEYLFSGNPGLFLTSPTQYFNEYGEIIKNAWYQIDGTDFKRIENFIIDVVIREEDPLKSIRENIYQKYLKTDGNASERIYNYIRSKLIEE